MNIPQIQSYHELAINTVISVINKATEKLGVRKNLFEYANSRHLFRNQIVAFNTLGPPLAITSEKLIKETIERKWRLLDTFMYIVRYQGATQDECSQYYYFEAIFSQPTVSYPVPQTTVSVFFRVELKHIDPPEMPTVPSIFFRIEGHHTDHDIRYVKLPVDWLLAVMQMKLKLFKRIEELNMF